MPTLPTLTVTDQTLYQRLVAAFHSDPAEYKAWLKNALRDEVQRREAQAIIDQANANVANNQAQLQAIMDGAS